MTLISVLLAMVYGNVDFNGLPKLSGPFGVGCRSIHVGKSETESKNLVLVFYPIDKK